MGCEQSKSLVIDTRKAESSKPAKVAAPKVDGVGHLLQEEVVKRTNSSFVVSDVELGDQIKGTVLRMRYAHWTQQGFNPNDPQKENQDRYLASLQLAGERGDALFGVFDGHGEYGHACSQFAKKKLPTILSKHIKQARVKSYQRILRESGKPVKASFKPDEWPKLNVLDYEACCRKTFLECNQSMHNSNEIHDEISGVAAVTVSFHFGRATICHVGNCRAILGKRIYESDDSDIEEKKEEEKMEIDATTNEMESLGGTVVAIPLTNDQTLARMDERERILQSESGEEFIKHIEDGEHDSCDPTAKDNSSVCSSSIVTRSLGDKLGEVSAGLCGDPEILTVELTKDDEILVLASDGVYTFLSNQKIIDICNKCHNPLEACDKVVRASYERWVERAEITDDITVIVCFLQKLGLDVGDAIATTRGDLLADR